MYKIRFQLPRFGSQRRQLGGVPRFLRNGSRHESVRKQENGIFES